MYLILDDMEHTTGSFTLPGEAGYEELTLRMAEKWGADIIRDCDGTKLSPEITQAGYGIYSTLCIIREDNAWAKAHPEFLQQNFLMTNPVIAKSDSVKISLLDGYFKEQFTVNKADDPKEFWEVFDRTTGKKVDGEDWSFDAADDSVTVRNVVPYHRYTVNFLAVRIWEEISMYNHVTNNWTKEHVRAIDPVYPEVMEHFKEWLTAWCKSNPDTTVVRFTSMFYNFAWFWSDNKACRDRFSDWGSYDFTANPSHLRAFEKKTGVKMTSEDFVNGGEYNATHNVPSKKYRMWMDYINEFVVEKGRELIDIVHSFGKKAYVFYDDSWIGVEPYSPRFKDFGFDGLIKCVFNGFEARMCAGAKGVKTHELRFHPYLFPTGLTGEPTFAPGGHPEIDAGKYWIQVRRALLRNPVDRIGLGGYLHLTEESPAFCDYMAKVADEFRFLKKLNTTCAPYTIPGKVAVIHSWGSLRTWNCSGHLHEHPEVDLTNVLESLAGLPFDVCFLSFDEIIEKGIPADVKALINAGSAYSAWSGGDYWKNDVLVSRVTEFVCNGGGFIGVHEPSAVYSNGKYFQLNDLLGVEKDTGTKKCIGKFKAECSEDRLGLLDGLSNETVADLFKGEEGVFVNCSETNVVASKDGVPLIAAKNTDKGKAVYFSNWKFSFEATRILYNALCAVMGVSASDKAKLLCSNVMTECAWYEESRKLVVINNSESVQKTGILCADGKTVEVTLQPFETAVL